MNLLKSKKGQVDNYIIVVAFLLIFGFLSMLGMTLFLAVKDGFVSSGFYDDNMAEAANGFQSGFLMFDYLTLFFTIILIMGVAITSYRISTNMVGFIVSVILSVFMGFVSYVLNYIFSQMISTGAFDTVMVYFPKTLIICTNLHWVALATFVIGSIALFAKRQDLGQFVEQ